MRMKRGLAGAVRSEHCEHLAAGEVEGQSVPEHSLAEAQAEARDRDDRVGGAHLESAARSARACASCHCWNVRPGGSVSVTGTTGMPAFSAALRSLDVIAEIAWLL